jgi:hypothetical protein
MLVLSRTVETIVRIYETIAIILLATPGAFR